MKRYIIGAVSAFCFISPAAAGLLEFDNGDWSAKLTGFGTGMALYRDSHADQALLFGDFRVRGQAAYAFADSYKLGAVYAIDQLAIDNDKFAKDLFLFFETPIGRAEIGQTESVSSKLGVALPDVGGMRMNEEMIAYKDLGNGPAILNPNTSGTRYALHANWTSVPTAPIQYGFSFAGLDDNFKYSVDAGLKYRESRGKIKTALSFGATFIDAPDNLSAGVYMPRATADWRAQAATGLNVQYNSWVFGAYARAVYDQNPIGMAADGISAGAGFSYDLLSYSVSLSYIYSQTGIWHDDMESFTTHIGVASARYKLSEIWDIWLSGGIANRPFITAGLRGKF